MARRRRQFWGIGTIVFVLLVAAIAVGINNNGASAETTGVPITSRSGEAKAVPLAVPLGSISGTVTLDGAGTPLTGMDVTLYLNSSVSQTTATAGDGTYTFSGLLDGYYYVQFSDPSATYPTEWYDEVPTAGVATATYVTAGSVHTGIDSMLGLPGSISGIVVADSTGTPIGGATVSIFSYVSAFSTAVTSSDGTYTVNGLPAGSYGVDFEADGYETGFWIDDSTIPPTSRVVVPAGGSVANINVRLVKATGIEGRIYDERNDIGLPGVVTAVSTTTGFGTSAGADTSGYYSLTYLVPGEYELVSLWTPQPLGTVLFLSDAPCSGSDIRTVTAGVVAQIDFILRSFCDVASGDWFFGSVEAIAAANVTNGYPDRSYRPLNTLTRAEAAAFMIKALGETPTTPTSDPFTDVAKEQWYAGYIERLSQLGFVNGYPDGTFRPNNTVTRAEEAAFMVNSMGESPTTPTSDPFTDVPKDQWYAGYVERLWQLRITKGYPDGTYRPGNTVNRAEKAAFLERGFLP